MVFSCALRLKVETEMRSRFNPRYFYKLKLKIKRKVLINPRILVDTRIFARILEGDHIPSGGQNAANAVTNNAGEVAEYDYEYYDDAKPDSVFVNPYDSSHQTVSSF